MAQSNISARSAASQVTQNYISITIRSATEAQRKTMKMPANRNSVMTKNYIAPLLDRLQ